MARGLAGGGAGVGLGEAERGPEIVREREREIEREREAERERERRKACSRGSLGRGSRGRGARSGAGQRAVVLARVNAKPPKTAVAAQALTRAALHGGGAGPPNEQKESPMLRIYDVILDTIVVLRPCFERIERKDPDLGRQMRRAASSMALNVSEGSYSRGRNRQVRYHSALGSARETLSCLEVAAAFGYLEAVDAETRNRFNTIVGTLMKLV